MKNLSILYWVLIFGLMACNIKQVEKETPSTQKNIIFIFADDLGYGDLSCFGSDSIATPNIDKLAQKGVKFTEFYSTSAICSPSRAGLLTGKYPIRNGIGPVFFHNSEGGLDSSVFTMVDMFKQKGYTTGIFGKWHLGHKEKYHPLSHGFDEFFGVLYSNDMLVERPWVTDFVLENSLTLYRNKRAVDKPAHQPTLTQRFTAEAIQFIGKNHDKPFFLYLPHTAPHEPLFPSAEFKGESKYGTYGDVVMEVDKSVGDIMQAQEDFGLVDNTVVVFSSDNGARVVPQQWGNRESTGSNGTLRGRKMSTFEGGIRVPTIAYGKDIFEGGTEIESPAIMCDWLPTFASIIGYNQIADKDLDGVDVLSENAKSERDFFFYYHYKLNAVRSGKWKLKFANPNRKRLEKLPHDMNLLFNLEADPTESSDLAAQFPEKVAALKGKAEAFKKSIAPLPPLQR